MAFNRSHRRELARRFAKGMTTEPIKAPRPERGFGITVTNRSVAILFWRWAWIPWERRA